MLLRRHYAASVVTWCRCVVVITTAQLNKAWIQVLCRFKSCSWRVGDSRWWGSLAMVPAGNKAKLLFISTISQNNSSSSSPWVLRTWECFFYPQVCFTLHSFLLLKASLPWGRQFNLKVTRTSCWSLKHSPGPTICLCHNKLQKIYTW